jgi:predicted transcriptional regulator
MPKKRDGVMTVRIPTDEKEQLQAIADQADVTLSDVVVRAVRDFIEANPLPSKSKKKANR